MEKHLEYLNQLDKNEIDNFKRTWMHNLVTMKWLKSRHIQKAKKQYLFFPEELNKHYEINELFRGFDADQSEGIDIQELISMFKDNKIQLDRQDVESIFKIIDFNGDHTLNLSEFKKSVFSDDINYQFSKVMRDLREKIEKKDFLENEKKSQDSIVLENQTRQYKQNKQQTSQLQIQSPLLNKQQQMSIQGSNLNIKAPSQSPTYIYSSSNQIFDETITSFPDKIFEEETQRVVPTTFSSMVEFFSYNFQRKEQIKKCRKFNSTQVGQKVNELSNLMNLNSKYTEHSLKKISKLSNKYGFHSFNLLSEVEDEGDNSNKKQSLQDKSKQNRKRQIAHSLSPLKIYKSQNNNNTINQVTNYIQMQISPKQEGKKSFQNTNKIEDNPSKENQDLQVSENNQNEKNINPKEQSQTIDENKNGNQNGNNSSITNQKQLIFQVKPKLHQSQSPTSKPYLNILLNGKKSSKQQSIDYSNSTLDRTGNIDKFSITLLNSSQKPFLLQKRNNKVSQINVSQDNPNLQKDISNKATYYIRNHDSPSRRQLNKLSKILNESEQIKKESLSKFLSVNSSPKSFQTNSKQKNIIIKKSQDQCSQPLDDLQTEYKDVHLAEETNQNNNKIFYMKQPFSNEKRQSSFMNSTLTSVPNKFQGFSLQPSPRNSSTTNFNINIQEKSMQKQMFGDNYQSNSITQLIEDISGKNHRRNFHNFYSNDKVKKRQSQKSIHEIPQLLQQQKELQNQELISARLRDNYLPQFPSYNNFSNTQAQNSLSSLQSNTQIKPEIQQISNKDISMQKGYLQQGASKNNIRSLSFFDKQPCKLSNIETPNKIQKDDHQEYIDNTLQKNLQILNEKKKSLQFPLQQFSCTNKMQKNNVLQNLFQSGNKKKVNSFYNLNNGMVTTPSTVNESLMGTLNTFNIQKNNVNIINNVQN